MTISQLIALIVSSFARLNGSTFVGLTYTNKKGETAKHVVIANASYFNACDRAIEILKGLTDAMFTAMADMYKVNNIGGTKYATNAGAVEYLASGKLPKEGTKAREAVLKGVRVTKTLSEIRDEMIATILKNRDAETRSASSEAQIKAYEYVEKGLKVHLESGQIVIFAKAHSKQIIVEGVYEDSDKEIETLQKEAISKYCKYELGEELPNEKFRKFNISIEQLNRLKVNGNEVTCE
jgi:hypothetical protein